MSTRSEIRERWRRLLQEQPASGLSVEAFCRRVGVQCSGFFKWRRKLRGERGGEATFAEVKLRPGLSGSPVAAAGGEPLELRLAGGPSIVVPRGFDRPTLVALLDVLSGSAVPVGREAAR